MATLEEVIAGLIEFRNTVYARIDTLKTKMDAPKSVQHICAHCGGDGIKGNPDDGEGSCPDCGGNGVIPFGRITLTTEE